MQELIGEGRNIKVIYNALPAIEPKTSINIRDNWSIRDDDTLLGCVARLIPSKGIDILLDAFDQIENRDKAIRLGNNARLIALRDFSVKKMIYQTLEVFEQI